MLASKKQKPAQPNTIIQRALILANFRAKGGTYTRQDGGPKNSITREIVDIAIYVDASFVSIHESNGLGGLFGIGRVNGRWDLANALLLEIIVLLN